MRPVSHALNVAFEMRHFITDTAEAITHEAGMTKHDIRSRKITNQIVAALECLVDRLQGLGE